MAQLTHVAMTDSLKIELIGEELEGASYQFSVFELINGAWHYLDSAPTKLSVSSSDGQIRKMLEKLAATYTEFVSCNKKNPVPAVIANQI